MKDRLGAPLPPGWERRTDVAEGRTYYFVRNTHTATYKRPYSSYVPGPPVPAVDIAPSTNSAPRLPESSANPAMLPRNADDDAQSDWTDGKRDRYHFSLHTGRGSDPFASFICELRACFAELAQRNEAHMDKLCSSVEGLKIAPPVVYKKTTFWNAYKTVTDDYDKEYQQKYSTDLDTSPIFAGLFSAVTSAFIIQIQPEIKAHGTPSSVVVGQCLLYSSLSLTLLAALLAVLGKQWLMYYSAAGERGTIEARGLERQRKSTADVSPVAPVCVAALFRSAFDISVDDQSRALNDRPHLYSHRIRIVHCPPICSHLARFALPHTTCAACVSHNSNAADWTGMDPSARCFSSIHFPPSIRHFLLKFRSLPPNLH
ncbi:hypothetical protein DFH06DRAFT_147376 [Mycena polygramma]|nr:hypothetical protein DFH06DRAFT_147376 [Mycena polygramma]